MAAAEVAAEATAATAVAAATEGAAATKAAATRKGAGATEGAAATAVAWRSTEHGGQLAVSCVSGGVRSYVEQYQANPGYHRIE